MRLFFLCFVLLATGCPENSTAPPPPPCDMVCQDGIAMRSLRETMKLAYNVTLQGKPVGDHDETTPCPFGGSVHITGTATADPVQGATNVDLHYVLDQCSYLFKDDDPKATYTMKLSGKVSQVGVLAVQPTATSSVQMHSDGPIDFAGSVYEPAIPYTANCQVDLSQAGSKISGFICGRVSGSDL